MASPTGLNNYVVNELHQDVQNIQGSNLTYFSKNWYKYTKDTYILGIVTNGLKLELNELPCQYSRSNYPLSAKENEVISTEMKKLLKKKVIGHSATEYNGSFQVFSLRKKDGSKRMILNLKNFNKFVNYKHFKMESNNVLNIIRSNVYMASIDLKDAFFSVPIHSTHQKYLKFTFDDLFQFTCMPNGYGPAMKVFTKISKVPFGHLISLSYNSVVYVDDSYLQGDTYQACLDNISDTIKLLRELGFVIHAEKSMLTPSQTMVFLGFIISSKNCH